MQQKFKCVDCGTVFAAGRHHLACPNCGSENVAAQQQTLPGWFPWVVGSLAVAAVALVVMMMMPDKFNFSIRKADAPTPSALSISGLTISGPSVDGSGKAYKLDVQAQLTGEASTPIAYVLENGGRSVDGSFTNVMPSADGKLWLVVSFPDDPSVEPFYMLVPGFEPINGVEATAHDVPKADGKVEGYAQIPDAGPGSLNIGRDDNTRTPDVNKGADKRNEQPKEPAGKAQPLASQGEVQQWMTQLASGASPLTNSKNPKIVYPVKFHLTNPQAGENVSTAKKIADKLIFGDWSGVTVQSVTYDAKGRVTAVSFSAHHTD